MTKRNRKKKQIERVMDPYLNVQQLTVAVKVDRNNLSTSTMHVIRQLLNNTTYWHKVTIHNAKNMHRDVVLKAVMDSIYPIDIIPVHYHLEGDNGSFLARNCKFALEKLCSQNLFVPNPENPNEPFSLSMIIAFSDTAELALNVQANVNAVLTKRYNQATKTLNLDNFHQDPELTEFCTLSQPKILYFVLHLSYNQFQIKNLILTNNGIRVMSSFSNFPGVKGLVSLDLRNNEISAMADLNILNKIPLTKLWLDGNPLCEAYDEYSFVEAIKKICPQLQKLDDVVLARGGFMAFLRNSLCNVEGQALVDQFLEHFFTKYDSINRTILQGLYHNNAMFSVTYNYLYGQQNRPTANLGVYKNISRNLMLLSDFSKCEEYLVTGKDNIINLLCKLPFTEHDPYTFTVDLLYYTEKSVILTVAGIFREVATSLLDPETILGFSRTFVLGAFPNGEYKIINEQLHITNATASQLASAFKFVRVRQSNQSRLDSANNEKERNDMEQTFMTITDLNVYWSRKCLEDCKYNFKDALELFVKLYKIDKIPIEAFTTTATTNSGGKTESVQS